MSELHVRWGAPRVPERAEDFLAALPGPTALRLAGRDPGRTRVVTTLLHGNEPSGLRALHAWLRRRETPATDALLVFGGVDAARLAPPLTHRMPPGRRDLNRCFRGPFDGRDGRLAAEILALVDDASVEALVDVHNNSGHNPPYGVAPRAGARELQLTALFARRFVENRLRVGALVEVARPPGVVIEVGRSGDPAADAVALEGLRRFLGAPDLWAAPAPAHPVDVLRDPRRVCLADGVALSYGEGPDPAADFTLRADVDRHNFEPMAAGVAIGWVRSPDLWPVVALGGDGRDHARELFAVRGGRLETRRPLVPIMMTTDPVAARLDCLFYAVAG